jgi:type IV pilus assembly protein PilC
MPEFRVDILSTSGKTSQTLVEADNLRAAKGKAKLMADQRKVKVIQVLPRATYLYQVQRGTEKPIKGEQKAYTKEEVQDALSKMGYKVLKINKKSFDFKPKPPPTAIVSFVRVSADLIRQKLPYNEILALLVNDIEHPGLRDAVKEINTELKQGKDSEKVFIKQEQVFGKFCSHMLGLASKSGNMADIYDSTAKFLERQVDFKKNLKSALITPMITLVALFGAVMFYVMDIFPEMAKIFQKFKIDMKKVAPMTYYTLQLSEFINNNIVWLLLIVIVPTVVLVRFFSTERGRLILDQYIWKIPVLGPLFHKTSIEIFCRVFYALYSGSGENIDVIKLSAEACGNSYMKHQILSVAIPMMVEKGSDLTSAFEATGVFTKTAISRFHSGAETGTVKTTAIQLAEYYEKETGYKMKNAIEFIQLWITMIIMLVLTGLTLVSSETAMIRPPTPGTK